MPAVAKEVIWNDSQIKCGNKILFYRKCYDKGIKLIEHISDFRIRHEQLQNLYSISRNDFLKYHTIVSNIKTEWNYELKEENYYNVPSKANKALYIVTQQKGPINKSKSYQ